MYSPRFIPIEKKKLTISKRDQPKSRTPKNPGVHTNQLLINNPHQLVILRCPLAIRRRGDDTLDIQSIASVLSVHDGVGDQFVCVGHAGGFGEIDQIGRAHV